MDTFARGLKQFRSLPSGDKIPVLLAGKETFLRLPDGDFDSILDEDALKQRVSNVSGNLGLKRLDNWIGALSDIITGVALTPDGMPGRISFPIFPFRAANKINLKPIQYVERDSLKVSSFIQYFGMFKHFHGQQKPRVVFSAEDIPEAESFFADIGDSIDLYRIFPDGLKTVSCDFSTFSKESYFDYLTYGSAQKAAAVKCTFPEIRDDFGDQQSAIVRNYFSAMAKQMLNPAFSSEASANISEILKYLDRLTVGASKEQFDFLISAKIQTLLLRILVDDDDQDALYEAITLSKAISSENYQAKCLRFVNQIAGVSSYAIDQLENCVETILNISRKEAFNPTHTLEYYAAQQNLFITRLFNRKPSISTSQAVDCLEAAIEYNKYFNELGMLANSVGLSFLCTGNSALAAEYLNDAAEYSADRLTNLNIQVNSAIAMHLQGGGFSDEKILMIFNEYRDLPLGSKSQYHAAMMFGNLWRLAHSTEIKSLVTKEAKKRKFISKSQSGDEIIPELKKRGFLFMHKSAFAGEYGRFLDHSGFMPAFHFNWSTPVSGSVHID